MESSSYKPAQQKCPFGMTVCFWGGDKGGQEIPSSVSFALLSITLPGHWQL